jgi:low temperature requirement protein LtrA
MTHRVWWQVPRIRTDEESKQHRKVSWLELFFDLFFVVIIARLSHGLAEDVSIRGVVQFVFLFLPVWWVWLGITYYVERFETEGVEMRLMYFTFMIPSAGLAIFAHHGLTENFVGFIGSFMLGRAMILGLWLRAGLHNPRDFGPVAWRFGAGFTVALCLYGAALTTGWPWRYLLVPAGLLVDLLTPLMTLRLQSRLPKLSTSKHPERFGLFALIVLGETVYGIGGGLADLHHLDAASVLTGILGLALGFSLWWVYFDFIGRRPFRSNIWVSYAWTYLHIPLFLSIVATGAGLLKVVQLSSDADSQGPYALVAGAAGLFLLSCAAIELTLRRTHDEPTHPMASPAIKAIAGAASALLAMCVGPMPRPVFLLMPLGLLGIQMAYGLYVWYGPRPHAATDVNTNA